MYPLFKAFQAEVMATWCGDGAVWELHAECAAEVLVDHLEGVLLLPVLVVVVVVRGGGGLLRGAAEELLAAARLVEVGERGVGLDPADGGQHVPGGAVSAGAGEGGRRGGGRGGGCVAGAVGAGPCGGVGEGRGFGEAGGVPWRGAGCAAQQVDLGRRRRPAHHAHPVPVARQVRHLGV